MNPFQSNIALPEGILDADDHLAPSAAFDPALSLTHTLREAARHGKGTVLLCSFQKEESVLIDELVRLDQGTAGPVRIVTIDTGVLFEETMQTWRAFEQHFGNIVGAVLGQTG